MPANNLFTACKSKAKDYKAKLYFSLSDKETKVNYNLFLPQDYEHTELHFNPPTAMTYVHCKNTLNPS